MLENCKRQNYVWKNYALKYKLMNIIILNIFKKKRSMIIVLLINRWLYGSNKKNKIEIGGI